MLSVFYLWVSGLLSAVDSMWATVARVTDFFFVYLRSLRNARPPRRVLGKLFSMLMGQTRATTRPCACGSRTGPRKRAPTFFS